MKNNSELAKQPQKFIPSTDWFSNGEELGTTEDKQKIWNLARIRRNNKNKWTMEKRCL